MLRCYQTRETPASGSSRTEEKTMMDSDLWLESVLIPEEGLTSVITISPSNTQSHHSMAPKWQKTLCSSRGKLGPLSGKGMCFGEVLWLFILVWREREWRHFCFWTVPGRVFLCLCVLTPWNVCWKRNFCNHCQHSARVFPAVVTDDYYRHIRIKKSMFYDRFFMIRKQQRHILKWLFFFFSAAAVRNL